MTRSPTRVEVELSLKNLLWSGTRLLDDERDLEMVHDLARLWRACRPILRKTWPEAPEAVIEAVG